MGATEDNNENNKESWQNVCSTGDIKSPFCNLNKAKLVPINNRLKVVNMNQLITNPKPSSGSTISVVKNEIQ